MLLLDTHALIWLATDLSKLTETAKSTIRFHGAELYLSAISALEISLLTKCRKLNWGKNPFLSFELALEHHCVKVASIDSQITWHAAQLPPIHRAPFDRMIISTAQKLDMPILAKDRIIPTYPKVKAVWE